MDKQPLMSPLPLSGKEVFNILKNNTDLESATKRLLWRCAHLKATCMTTALFEDDDLFKYFDSETKEAENFLLRAFFTTSINKHHKQPLIFLINYLIDEYQSAGYEHIGEYEINFLLQGFIQSNSLAPWMLSSEVTP